MKRKRMLCGEALGAAWNYPAEVKFYAISLEYSAA
jgi:hypothetical protein